MRPPFDDTSKLGFGKYFTDYLFEIRYSAKDGWHDGQIKKRGPFSLDPAASVLHYAQEIFEGLKAYASPDGEVLLFRPEANARRMNRSAQRLCMPELPEDVFINGISELVLKEKQWIPREVETSLYIRPTMVAVESFLGLKTAEEYIFYVILSPVGPYFKEGFNPVGIYVEEEMTRACAGGIGEAKTGGNYAASILALKKAKDKGFAQVLFLDAKEKRYLEEVGAMNVFVVYDNKLVTPALGGTILPGITRDSVIKIAQNSGITVEERSIAIDEVIEGLKNGRVTEMFGTGTAAVISPVGALRYKEQEYPINNNKVGELTESLYRQLVDIQYGKAQDKYGWVRKIGRLRQ